MNDARIVEPAVQSDKNDTPHGVEELLRRYAAGERRFSDLDIPEGSSLNGATLEGAVFVNSWLSDIDFRNANLKAVRFDHCNVKCSDFGNADLRFASFPGSHVEATDFKGAQLENASFAGALSYGGTLGEKDIPTI